MMDDVQLINLGPEGKETRLIKRLEAAEAASQPAPAPPPRAGNRRSSRKARL